MWNAGYNFGEHQNGYGYNNEFNSYQQGNRYSDFYEQQQPDLYPDYYQPSSLQEPYFTSSEQYYPPQDQPTDDVTEIRAMMLRLNAMMQQRLEEHNEHNEYFARELEESKIRQAEISRLLAHNEMMDNRFDSHVASESDQFEVLSNDIEVKVVGEDVNDEDNAENAEKQKFLELQAENRPVFSETDRFLESKVGSGFSTFGTDRFEGQPIGFGPKLSETRENDPETDWLPPEATPNVDSTCLDSFEDDTDSYNEVDHLIYALIMGEGLTREHRERALEVIRAADTHVLETETIESEPPYNEELHHGEPSSSPTCVDLRFEQGKEANHTSSVENSVLVQQSENQQLLVVDQASVELSNKRKLEWPSAKTYSETPLLKRHSNTSEHLLGKESVWGRKKNFELTGEGDYGGYPSGIVVNEVECDPEAKGRYLGRSYGGFRDQFYIDPGSSTGGIWSRNEYHGPWFND